MNRNGTLQLLNQHQAHDDNESRDLGRLVDFVRSERRFWQRDNMAGHITASAWIVTANFDRALLVHHRKLDRWLQPGGHIDDDSDALSGALREAREESGLTNLKPHTTSIFDVDIHLIPARKSDSAHHHFDIRFLLVADHPSTPVASSESHDVRWFDLDAIQSVADEASLLRMVAKTRRLR